MDLSDEQQDLLGHPPYLSGRVLAGPGTGKSFMSVMYLAQLSESAKHKKLRVRYITFTRAATAEFADKLRKRGLFESPAGQPPKTMHAYSLRILRTPKNRQISGIPDPLRIPDDWEQEQLIRPDISRLLRAKGYKTATPSKVAALEAELSAGFQSLTREKLPIAAKEPKLVQAYQDIWEEHRRRYGYTLLSELPIRAAAVLARKDAADPEVDLLIVDEYQDLNQAEQLVLQELHKRGVAILAIGDDDQSIYSWRNAAPEGIRNFTKTFDTECDYPLTVCHRTGAPALKVAAELINQDRDRPTKKPLTPSATASTEFRYLRFPTDSAEAAGVARIVRARLKAPVKPGDDPIKVAVLVRSDVSAWAAELAPQFAGLGIPLAAPTDIDSILKDRGVRIALALGQLIRRKGDDSLAWRALLKVTPGVGDTAVDHIYGSAESGSFAARFRALHANGFPELRNRIEVDAMVQGIQDAMAQVPKRKGPPVGESWAAWLVDQVKQIDADVFTPDAEKQFKTIGDKAGQRNLNDLLNKFQPTLRESASGADYQVQIMTMAMSKGLTFDTAIVVGAEEGNIPNPRGDEGEELRYLYVALTRATHLTVVTYAQKRTGRTAPIGQSHGRPRRWPSPLMTELSGVKAEDGVAAFT
ncbi:MAG TPA: ATP-dependent helicase [Mycobacterium sp.]|uniref:ATP-dependent helicase n=1 Tax=Mycobacterium sp. TaxID=1785 RepID=UPI002B842115|nr:ATP-dependent helicase [Mycobacterium sp.]HME77925.1 ATP-dependent helicase [Mycobacterium sp.]